MARARLIVAAILNALLLNMTLGGIIQQNGRAARTAGRNPQEAVGKGLRVSSEGAAGSGVFVATSRIVA
jgi:hypothetical protein